jgi:hypothetical protein
LRADSQLGLHGLRPSDASIFIEKDDPGRVHETLGISHAYPNRLNE